MVAQIGFSELLIIIGFLIALDNVITQVLKKVFYEKVYGNVIATVVGILITVFFGLAYCSYKTIAIQWYYIPALVVGGFLVAYGSMFGFQALQETLNWNNNQKAKKVEDNQEVVCSDK